MNSSEAVSSVQGRRASSLRREQQPQNYSKPVRAAQFSPSPIRKQSMACRAPSASAATSSFKTSMSPARSARASGIVSFAGAVQSRKSSRQLNSRSVSSMADDDDKENQTASFCAPTVPTNFMKQSLQPHQTSAKKEHVSLSSCNNQKIQVIPLEVDELGLFNLNRNTHAISLINPKDQVTREFCQPMLLKHHTQTIDSKHEPLALTAFQQLNDSQHTITSTIAERRSQKLISKAKASESSQKIQLPNIKDTSEGGPVSDIISNSDFGEQQLQVSVGSLGRSQISMHADKEISSQKNHTPTGLIRQQTCQIQPTNYFVQQNSIMSAQESQCSSSKKKGKDSSLHGRWTDMEHRLFLEGMHRFKKDWRSIERHIGTRTCSQIRSHAQKYFMRLEKQQSGDVSNLDALQSFKNSSKASVTNKSEDSHPMDHIHHHQQRQQQEAMKQPAFVKMLSSGLGLERHSSSKKAFKTDISQLEQELSQSQTLGHTPTQQNLTPPPNRSSTKRRKVSHLDDPFRSQEKQTPFVSTTMTPKRKIFGEEELRQVALSTELARLRHQRDELCAQFSNNLCGIPQFCIQLDLIGKKFADNCLFASIYNLDQFTQKYDTETLLTRMLLKGMIEYLSSSVQPSALQAAMQKLNELQFDEVHQSTVAVGSKKE